MPLHTIRKFLKKYLKKRPWKTILFREFNRCPETEESNSSKETSQNPSFLADVWFTDESWFTGGGIAQKRNAYYWALTRDAVKRVGFQKHPTEVHVWPAISVRGIIGPYFFHAGGKNISVNQSTY